MHAGITQTTPRVHVRHYEKFGASSEELGLFNITKHCYELTLVLHAVSSGDQAAKQ